MTNVRFRRSLNICFLVTIIAFICAWSAMLYLRWSDARNSYQQRAEQYVHNQSALINNYLSFDENILLESAIQIANDKRITTLKTAPHERLFQWFIGHLLTTPDILSIIYADNSGELIHFPLSSTDKPGNKNNSFDPTLWYQNALEGDAHSIYYNSSTSQLSDKHKILNLSTPVINNEDGSKAGVLALQLNADFAKKLLQSIPEPFTGYKSIIINPAGEQIIVYGEAIATITLKKIINNINNNNGSFYINNNWYTYTTSKSGWYIVYKIANEILYKNILNKCSHLFWVGLFSLLSLLSCWWMLHITMNNIYLHIAASVRNGIMESKAADQILYDEIYNNMQQKIHNENKMLTDSLTGLRNRRSFDNDIALLESETECCVALLDIDSFKFINDTYGHAVGDTVLKTIADIGLNLLEQTKQADNIKIYRYGGEEIAILSTKVISSEIYRFLNLWRNKLSVYNFKENNLRVTFSGGMCIKKNMNINTALNYADKALYRAKNNGKNQIIIA